MISFLRRSRKSRAFTLLELMVVVTIIAVLATVAIPMMTKYMRKSKTSEAPLNLRKIFDGEVSYYQEELTTSEGTLLTKAFINAGPSPSQPPGKNKILVNWESGNWPLIKFSSDSPVLYSYSVVAAGENLIAAFTARAEGDLDEDGVWSLFERVGAVDPNTGEVVGGGAIFVLDELE